MKNADDHGLTWVEVLVALAICGVLLFLVLPVVVNPYDRDGRTQSLSNMKQLHLATEAMVVDGVLKGNPALNWPGDTGGTFSNWTHALVENQYLSTNDLCKLLSAAGVVVPLGTVPTTNNTAVLVYAVSEDSPANTVFLTSANFTNTLAGGGALERSAKPYGNKGFVIFRKSGDGAILQARQVGDTNLIGGFVPLCQ